MGSRSSHRAGDPPRVGVVTVAYHSESVLPRFLGSIGSSTEESVALVIADNAPGDGDGAARALAERFDARYLRLPQNPGYGAAVNAGVRALPDDVEWVLVSNPDVEIQPHALDRLLAAAVADSRIGAVGPAIFEPSGIVYPSARALPSLRTGVGHALFANLWPANPWTRRYHSGRRLESRDADWLSGACLLVRRSAFDRVGGFDESYFMYFEDVDLGMRLSRSGYRNLYEPSARVIHLGSHSTISEGPAMLEVHHRSARRYLERRYRGPLLAPLRWILRAGLGLRLTAEIRRHDRAASRVR